MQHTLIHCHIYTLLSKHPNSEIRKSISQAKDNKVEQDANYDRRISESIKQDFYISISKLNLSDLDGFEKEQLREEIEKAKQILDEDGNFRKYEDTCKKKDGSTYNTWEEIIIDAENYAFFKGAIRFLFRNSDGNLSDCDWKSFGDKFENARKYFSNEDCVSNDYLRYYISLFDKEEYFGKIYYDSKNDSWRDRMLNKDLSVVTDNFLRI